MEPARKCEALAAARPSDHRLDAPHGLRRASVELFLFIVVAASAAGQPHLGPLSLLTMPALELKNPMHLSVGLSSQVFLATVGGVAFDAVAAPAQGQPVSDLALAYHPDLPDGSRLGLTVNGRSVAAPLPDWQLVPIARFADSPYYSVFTLFGRLQDPAQEDKVLQADGRIMNYHPAFTDTLLGLRMFQLDILVLYESAADLPQDGEVYILGSGEKQPDLRMNGMGSRLFATYLTMIQSDLGMRHRSYVICDHGQSVRLDATGDRLGLTGEPYYYYWRYRYEGPDYDQQAAQDRIAAEVRSAVDAARSRGGAFNERAWLVDALVRDADRYAEGYRVFSSGTIVDLVALPGEIERRASLDRYATESLYRLLESIRFAMEAHEVRPLKEYSDMASAKPDLLRGINAAVWDTAVTTMRYAAFFRYCKQSFPEAWSGFLRTLPAAAPGPAVRTPTVLTGQEVSAAGR